MKVDNMITYKLKEIIAVFFIASAFSVSAENYNFKPGLWETKISVEIKGVPEEMAGLMKPPVMTERECVTKDDVNFVIQQDKVGENCKITNKTLSANKIQMKMLCVNNGVTTKGEGEINLKDTLAEGWFDMIMPGPMGQMTMRNNFKSKYVGPCDK